MSLWQRNLWQRNLWQRNPLDRNRWHPNPIDVRGSEYVPDFARGELQGSADRAVSSGAVPPLSYIGIGMTSIIFCDARRRGFKVGRYPAGERSDVARRFLTDEAEWLATANQVPFVREHVARFYRFHPAELVIERECVEAVEYRLPWGARKEGRLDRWDLHQAIGRALEPFGWTSPEYKDDSYVMTRDRGWVLVDASMGHRIGSRLVAWIADVLSGRRPWEDERPSDMAFYVLQEVRAGTIPLELGRRLYRRLEAISPEPLPFGLDPGEP